MSNHSSGKFSLYVKTQEIKQISQALENIMLLPVEDRLAWIDENGEMMHYAFDSFIEDSAYIFKDVGLDDEALELSENLVKSLRNAVDMIESILDEKDRLVS